MANIPIRIIQRGTTTLKTKGKVCREDIDVIVEVEGGQNYLVAKNEAEMNMFLANEKYVGSFVRYIGTSGTYIKNECYLISNAQEEYPQYIDENNAPLPEGGFMPVGRLVIDTTKEVNVREYATAQVVDANLTADNIRNGKTILGVTGTFKGSTVMNGIMPTGILEIKANGTYDVTHNESVIVNVPTCIEVATEGDLPSDSADGTVAIVGTSQTVYKKQNGEWVKIGNAESILSAPTISLNGDTLQITDTSGKAEMFDILVDGVVRASVENETDNAVEGTKRLSVTNHNPAFSVGIYIDRVPSGNVNDYADIYITRNSTFSLIKDYVYIFNDSTRFTVGEDPATNCTIKYFDKNYVEVTSGEAYYLRVSDIQSNAYVHVYPED